MSIKGQHLICEYYECNSNTLDNLEKMEQLLLEAAHRANAKVINKFFHKFSPNGITGVVMLAESHISIHTWPDLNYAAVDIFTCGEKTTPVLAYEYMVELLNSKKHELKNITRGTKL